jgi:hypothetical protein
MLHVSTVTIYRMCLRRLPVVVFFFTGTKSIRVLDRELMRDERELVNTKSTIRIDRASSCQKDTIAEYWRM